MSLIVVVVACVVAAAAADVAAVASAFRQLDAQKLWRLRCPFPLVVAGVIFEIFTA